MTTSKDWYKKADVDYFALFVNLWLSFNALYKQIYSIVPTVQNDREHIEQIKNSVRANNPLLREFIKLFEGESSEASEFRFHLKELIRMYDGMANRKILNTEARPQMHGSPINELSFKQFIHPKTHHLKKKVNGYLKIDGLYIRNDNLDELWKYYLETVYMIRNMLIHGSYDPSDDNHRAVKNCYVTLRHLIKEKV